MSIFSAIKDAIFGGPAHAGEMPTSSAAATPGASPASPTAAGATSVMPSKTPVSSSKTVDVAASLDTWAKSAEDHDLDWRKSIVDLMKILKLDSSLKARKALATELHYTGDMGDSASMNMWLHKQVMTKLAENGGTVPADLKH